MSTVKKPLKRLQPQEELSLEKDNKVKVFVTEKVVNENQLEDLAPKKLFFLKPRIVKARLCYVPCRKIILGYSVSYFSASRTDAGSITFVVDDKKGTGVIEDNVKLSLIKKNINSEIIEKEFFSDEQATKKAVVDARWKVLMARYKKPAELDIKSVSKFYRPYYEVVYSHGSREKRAWIPADIYGTYFVYN